MALPKVNINYRRFFGLSSKTEVEKLIHKAAREAKLDMGAKLIAFHRRYESDQKSLESSFDYSNIAKISVNFWDDFYDDGHVPEGEVTNTVAYVEDETIPDVECHKILTNLLRHIQENKLLPCSVKMRIQFTDLTAKYPNLVEDNDFSLAKKWEIGITNITHCLLEELIVQLKDYSNGSDFSIYSES